MPLVEMLEDVYPYGCRGDVVKLEKDDLAALDKVKQVRKREVYRSYSKTQKPAQQEDAERQAEDAAKQDAADPTLNELRARAKELDLSGAGTKEELQARIEVAEKAKAEAQA